MKTVIMYQTPKNYNIWYTKLGHTKKTQFVDNITGRFLPAPITDLICCKPIPPLSLKWGGGSAGAQAGEPQVDYRAAAQKLRSCTVIPALSRGQGWNIEIRVLNLTKKEKPRLLTKYTNGLHARNKETKQDK